MPVFSAVPGGRRASAVGSTLPLSTAAQTFSQISLEQRLPSHHWRAASGRLHSAVAIQVRNRCMSNVWNRNATPNSGGTNDERKATTDRDQLPLPSRTPGPAAHPVRPRKMRNRAFRLRYAYAPGCRPHSHRQPDAPASASPERPDSRGTRPRHSSARNCFTSTGVDEPSMSCYVTLT
jgi:hypothetical protein